MIVDALGNPLALSLTGGQVHDITQAGALLALIEPAALLGDKGYDADHFVDRLTAPAIKPPKSNRKVNAIAISRSTASAISSNVSSAQSSIFERFATRYEKTARNFLAGLHLTGSGPRRVQARLSADRPNGGS
nr:transposase [Bradyrhizobium canariense]